MDFFYVVEDGMMLSEAAYPQLLNASIKESKSVVEKFKKRCIEEAKV